MFENSQWICSNKVSGRLRPFKFTRKTDEREDALKQTLDASEGSVLFRKPFRIDKTVARASLSISGLGYYYAYINGASPDPTGVFAPIVSDYYRLTRYDAYNVTDLLVRGENVVGAELCGGWFATHKKWWGWRMTWYGEPRLTARLDIAYEDGTSEAVVSGTDWQTSTGAVTYSDIYDGENADFRLEQKGWNAVGFDCRDWDNAVIAEAPTDNFVKSIAPPVRIIRALEPVSIHKLSDDETVYDFGENNAAIPRVTVCGKSGDTVTLKHAEFINADGTLDRRSENNAECTDRFTLSGNGDEICSPRFS